MGKRLFKQFIIGIIYLMIFFGIGLSIYAYVTPDPNCEDGIYNGDEEGVDCGVLACGLPCPPEIKPFQVTWSKVIRVTDGEYDFVAQVYNPNNAFGASRVLYEYSFYNESSKLLTKQAMFYIAPGQTKYVIVPSVPVLGTPTKADLEIISAQWHQIDPLGNVNFPLRTRETEIINGQSKFRGVVINDSDFDFNQVDIRIALIDGSSGSVQAVNATNIRTLISKEERQFEVVWPIEIDFSKYRIDVEIDTNLSENFNYIRRYGKPGEEFQKYY